MKFKIKHFLREACILFMNTFFFEKYMYLIGATEYDKFKRWESNND